MSRRIASNGCSVVLALCSSALCTDATFAGDSASKAQGEGKLEEILVTAQRRDERLQDVPIAVAALSSEALTSAGLTGMQSLNAAVPALTFSKIGASGIVFVRGIGSAAADPSSEPSVATYVDGVYIAAPNANVFDFNGVDSVEVLKGPQGTLFGRNATGGVIHVRTKDPSSTASGEASVSYGNYDTAIASAYLTGGLTENIAANLAARYKDQGSGFGHNRVTGLDSYKTDDESIRGKLLFEPSDATRVLFSADYHDVSSTQPDYQYPNGVPGPDGVIVNLGRYETAGGARSHYSAQIWGGSVVLDHDFESFMLKSISAYRKFKGHLELDGDALPPPLLDASLHLRQENFSQEIHFASPEGSRINWLAGAYYIDSKAGYDPLGLSGDVVGGISLGIISEVRTKSASVFAQGTTEIFEDTNLTVGLRYTDEKQEFQTRTESSIGTLSPEASTDQSFKKPTWRLAVDHKFAPNVLGYVSYNRGIKSGGYSPSVAVDIAAFDPEKLDAYEVGLKSELLDRRLRLNVSAFWYDYKNIQVQVVNGPNTFTDNAAAARVKGIDLDFEAVPADRLTIRGGIAYTDGRYRDFADAVSYAPAGGTPTLIDASDNRMVRAPEVTGSATVQYQFPLKSAGAIAPSLTAIYSSKFYWAPDNRPAQPDYTLLNALIRWTSENEFLYVDLWGNNLTDRAYVALHSETSLGDNIAQADPRTYGVTFGVKFK